MEHTKSRHKKGPSAVALRRVPAVARATAILRLLAKSEEALGVNAIARALGLVPSTCLHILRTLVQEELVSFDSNKKVYCLDVGILTLARSIFRRSRIADLIQPALDELVKTYPVTAVAVQAIGLEHIVVVAISGTQLEGRIHVEIGGRFPALMSATGRCLAAFGGFSQSEIDAQLKKIRWDRPPSLKAWRNEVEAARRRKYSVDIGNYISGVTILAAPVFGEHERMTHALVLVGVSKQVAKQGLARVAADLQAAAAKVSLGIRAAAGRS